MSEIATMRTIILALAWKGFLVWRENNIAIPLHRPDGKLAFRRGDPRRKGIPDVFALKDGHLYGIEVKSATGRQSTEQKQWQEDLARYGGTYILARLWNDVEKIIK